MDKPMKSVTHGKCGARPTVTFPAAGHHRPLTGIRLHWLVTEVQMCVNNLPKVVYLKAERPRFEPSESQVQRYNHYATRPRCDLKLIHTAPADMTRLSRLPVDRRRCNGRRPDRQLRLAARPPTRSDVVRHAKCKHAVDCCVWLNLNFFAKRHATRVIYRLTVQICQTVSILNSHRLTRRVRRAVWTGH